ncbi:hypothetical protein JW756_01885 [Candidatus Woesearchaeota archaeon]|nr:hypothetical protein [Candidatus Woesearchaeota archaeon]
MKYNLNAFNNAVNYYQQNLKNFRKKTVLIVFDAHNEQAFFSMAPLSRALHNLGCELSVRGIDMESPALEALMDVWEVFDGLEKGVKNEKTIALNDFIAEADKKAKGEIRKIFRKPDVFILDMKKDFLVNGDFPLKFRSEWFRKYRWDKLLETGKVIWKQVYNLKKSEKAGLGFDLIWKDKAAKYPLEDYLDSYAIARTMWLTCYAKKKPLSAYTSKKTMLEPSERIGELAATLLGCELEKDIDEPVFKKFKKLSTLLKLDRFSTNDVSFSIKGEGYPGKHIFGETIGYPTPNKKSRWDSPGGIIYQLPWYPQTKVDPRSPRCRIAFTDTLPLDIYISSCCIDWLKMKKKNDALIRLANKSDRIFVESAKTNLEVNLLRKNKSHVLALNSDVDVRWKLDPNYLKKGIKAGTYANIPGGEMFLSPEWMKGTFYGDVVISIDKSYVLNSKQPLIVKCDEKGYKIISGPKDIIKKINEKKNESMKVLLKQEKSKSLPQEIINLKKANFNHIGEFAINTNPTAELCKYLIVNEKIAGMMHIALGSGFEDDRASVYHYDIVINAKEQKLDIYGIKKGKGREKEKKLWMMKKGKLAV